MGQYDNLFPPGAPGPAPAPSQHPPQAPQPPPQPQYAQPPPQQQYAQPPAQPQPGSAFPSYAPQQPMAQPPPQQQWGQQPQQPPMQGGWADGIAGADVGNRGGQYFECGNFVIDVTGIKIITPQDGGTSFVAEFKVVESDRADTPPGSDRSWVKGLPGIKNMGNRDVKDFMTIVVEEHLTRQGHAFDKTQPFDPRVLHMAVSQEQPFNGCRLHLHTWPRQQKADATKTFTVHDWRALPPGTVLGLVAAPPDAQPQLVEAPAPQQPGAAPPQQQQYAPQPMVAPAPNGAPNPNWPAERPPNYPVGLAWPPTG